jgi:hypothetical protein
MISIYLGGELRKLIAIRLAALVLGWLRQTTEKRIAVPVARERDLGDCDVKGELALNDMSTEMSKAKT